MDAQGALDSLLGRLTTILINEAQLLGGVRGDVEFIKDEMESMNGLLLHLTEAHHRDHQVRAWMKQVSGLTRDCGDNVELYVHYVGGGPGGDGLVGHIWRIVRFVRTVSIRRQIASRIQELKVRARDVGDRRQRYGVTVPPVLSDQHGTIFIDRVSPLPGGPEEEEDLRRSELLYGEPPDTVEEGTKRVLKWILDARNTEPWYRKLFLIEGRGRAGKTAIARRVYEHPSIVSSHSRIWVSFGGVHRAINEVYQEIRDPYPTEPKKDTYLIVLDSVQCNEDMRILLGEIHDCKLFYPRANVSILLTVVRSEPPPVSMRETRVAELGRTLQLDAKVFNVHEPGTRANFFRSRALALTNCSFSPVDEVLNECYPDAFALQMLLHLLYVNPNRSERELNRLRDLLKENRNNIAKTMFMFCYNELPVNYKSCLLYLSVFPQDQPIRRTSLLRRWIAEGLISERSIATPKGNRGMNPLDDRAEHIFHALVARGFVRPAETSTSGKIKSFNVNHLIQEFIATDVSIVETSLPHDLAHRLSINSGIAVQEAYSSNRSLDVTETLLELMPQSPQWQLLKVLDLEGVTGFKKKHLKNICEVLLLKYLSLRNTDVTELPKQIEKLQCLETLDIRQTAIKAFSTRSISLPMLKYLLAGHKKAPSNSSDRFQKSFVTVHLPSSMQRMKNMEILSHVEVSDNVDNIADISQLLQLRKLGVILHGKKGGLTLLFQQIQKLYFCLRSLSIRINQLDRSNSPPDAEVVPALVTPPKLLESLSISGITSGLPPWIAELDQLAKVTLEDTFLGEDAIHVLGKLRMLRCLRLLHKSYTGSELIFKAEEFQRLRFLIVEGSDVTHIRFCNTAAPKLERITWSFGSMEALYGIDHLPKLKKLELDGDCNNLDPIKEALKAHPNHPELKHTPLHQSPQDGTAVAAPFSSAP